MKRFILIMLLILVGLTFVGCHDSRSDASPELEELYDALDEEIERSRDYDLAKEKRIVDLKRELVVAEDEQRRTLLLEKIAEEFEAYNADSTLYYLDRNLDRKSVRADRMETFKLKIRKADVFAHAGLFSDALEILRSIPRDSLDNGLAEEYYSTYCATYQYLSEYTNEHSIAGQYEKLRALYTDSLNMVTDPKSFNRHVYVVTAMGREGHENEAIDILTNELEKYESGTREYSILASTLAYLHNISGHTEEHKRYLVLSAVSDVKGAVKENMSFRAMATVMYYEGDVERANRYLKKSIADANFYSAYMRNAQSSKMLPVIDDAYTSRQNAMTSRLKNMVLTSAILSVGLILTLLIMLKQFRSLGKANEKIRKANAELTDMSGQLKDANSELKAKNEELSELSEKLRHVNEELARQNVELHDYNKVKEQYAGLFMEFCSSAISTLQHYQQSLRVAATKGGDKKALLNKLESSDAADQLLKNFYARFDEAILNIYPDFIERFNDLLRPEERVEPKAGELLNTELRLFALIRLGIDDSAKIANFLRCSLSTVYTYRSKTRKRALDPATFEASVKNIHTR